jgi:hypothetical protein
MPYLDTFKWEKNDEWGATKERLSSSGLSSAPRGMPATVGVNIVGKHIYSDSADYNLDPLICKKHLSCPADAVVPH